MNYSQIKTKYPAPKFLPVLISEVTRMSQGNHCVAGLDVHSRRMVRPLQSSGANWGLGTDRSIFSVGHLVNCVPTGRHNTIYPHATEDLLLSAPPLLLETFDESTTYALLLSPAVATIRQLFGRPLIDHKYLPENTSCCSLGGVRTSRNRTSFMKDGYGKFRLRLRDVDSAEYRLPVTCDTLCHVFSPNREDAEPQFRVEEANEWLSVNSPDTAIVLRIGLARGWAGRDGDWHPRRCYAQLNGIICPRDSYHVFAGPPSL